MKNIRSFYLKNFLFLVVKFSMYLKRRVFVMFAPSFVALEGLYLVIVAFPCYLQLYFEDR